MNQIWEILKWEYVNRVGTKLFIFTTFGVPLFVGAIIYLPTLLMDLEPENKTRIGLIYPQNLDDLMSRFKNRCSQNLLTQHGDAQFTFNKMVDEKEALNELINKKIDGYLIIPNDVLDKGIVNYYGKSLSNIKIHTNLKRTLSQLLIEERMILQNIDLYLVGQLSRELEFFIHEIDDFGKASKGDELSSFLIPYLFLMILFSTIFMSGQLLLRSVMEERTSRTIEILLSSVTPDKIMIGKILGLGAIGLTQMVFYLAVGLFVTHFKGYAAVELSQLPSFFIYFITGYLFYSAIFASMGTFFSSEQEAQQSSGLISIIAVLPIAFASYFITNPGSFLTMICTYIPPLTPFMMIIRLGTKSVDLDEIFYTTILMIVFCLILLRLSGKIFRTAILLYGKKVTFREVVKWVRA